MAEVPAEFWAPPSEERWQRKRPNTYGLAAGLIAFGIVMVLFPLYALSDVDARIGERIPLTDVRHGVSVRVVDGERVFIVREGREVTGFQNTSPHLGVGLWWCPRERVFLSPAHGEVYDTSGRLLRGQSPVDMRRVELDVVADRIIVRPNQLLPPVPARPRSEGQLPADIRSVIATGSCSDHVA